MANIIIGVRFCTNKLQRIKFENVELNGKVRGLKEKASQQIGTPMDQIDLMYAGMILEDDQPMKSYGITPGVMVHVLKKRMKKEVPAKTFTEAEIIELAASIRTTIKKGFAFFLTKLTNADEIRTEVFAHLPPTCIDPVARAIALDPQLHSMLSNVTTLRQVIARHPDIVEVVRAMGIFMLKRQAELKAAHAQSGSGRHFGHSSGSGSRSATSSTQTAGGSARYAMFEDDDVDIEDVDADVDGDNDDDLPSPISGSSSGGGYPLARNASYNAITAAQLANAIANATHLTTRSGLAGTPTTPRPILGNASAGAAPVITSEMFSGALQHAFSSLPAATAAATVVAGASPVLPAPPPLSSSLTTSQMAVDELRVRYQQQLMQMREMGLLDEAANIRALQATVGNVQAAIDLVFNADIE